MTSDPDDEMFIECAVAAGADFIVTGDKAHLLRLQRVENIPVIRVSSFLGELGVPENPA